MRSRQPRGLGGIAFMLFALLGLPALAPSCGTDCDQLERRAKELRSEYEACSGADRCVVVDLGQIAGSNNCVGPFQCSTAVRQGTNLDEFGRRARAIVDEYKSGCDKCTMASCQGPVSSASAQCNAAQGRCELIW